MDYSSAKCTISHIFIIQGINIVQYYQFPHSCERLSLSLSTKLFFFSFPSLFSSIRTLFCVFVSSAWLLNIRTLHTFRYALASLSLISVTHSSTALFIKRVWDNSCIFCCNFFIFQLLISQNILKVTLTYTLFFILFV